MDIKHINRATLAIAEKHDIDLIEAYERMNNSSIWLIANDSIRDSFAKQLAFLTTVNIARRVFLKGVNCVLPQNTLNLLKMSSLYFNDMVVKYGGKLSDNNSEENDIKILFGLECYDDNCIESISSGWRGGVNFNNQKRIEIEEEMNYTTLGPVASASLACFYSFCKCYNLLENNIEFNCGITLWDLGIKNDWYKQENDGPKDLNFPRNIWNLGLGHLGQAYIWTLGLMNCRDPKKVNFLLQDSDIVEAENFGSQVLSTEQYFGLPKTRPCVSFLEDLGFKTQIIEKPFINGDAEQAWMENFHFLLNGVDNVKTRISLTKNNLQLFLDGATNGRLQLFDSFTMKNISKSGKNIDELWPDKEENTMVLHKNLYDRYEKEHRCGYITNHGISTPFIGLFSSTILIAELLRSINFGKCYSVISLQLRDLGNIEAKEAGTYNREFLRFAI
jgi:molybdopterin/thiamine biosynthesis adenylyltransferase